MEKIIYTKEEVVKDIEELLRFFPKLEIIESNEMNVLLSGTIGINVRLDFFSLRKDYFLEICIPLNLNKFPYVIDVGNHIESHYPHIYQNRILCLETNATIAMHFLEKFNLFNWMNEFVIPYYVSYEYYQQYGIYPFGQRSHGWKGILESYSDILKTNDCFEAYKIMRYISLKTYRGHNLCPCGSGNKIRCCHGKYMLQFYKKKELQNNLKKDLLFIEKGCFNEKKARRNT